MHAPVSGFRQFPDLCFILEDVANISEKPEDSLQVGWSVIASEGKCEAGERKGDAGVARERALKAQLRALHRGKRCPKYRVCDTQEAWDSGQRS